MLEVLKLFWSFCQIGFTSFGGLSMIPLISSEMISHGWMTAEEVSDIVAIAEMTPGPLGLNCATFSGIRVAGMLGALAANLGMLMPTFTLCAAAAFFFAKFRKSDILKRILVGVRPVSIGLVWAVITNLSLTNYFPDLKPALAPIFIGGTAVFLLMKKKWSIPRTILLSALLGILFC